MAHFGMVLDARQGKKKYALGQYKKWVFHRWPDAFHSAYVMKLKKYFIYVSYATPIGIDYWSYIAG